MMNGSTHRYAAIVTGPNLVTPGVRWRRLSRGTRPVLGMTNDMLADRRESTFDLLGAQLTAELPLNIDLSQEIPVLLLPYEPDWRGGILADHEIDLVFDNARQPHAPKPKFVSTAIDALGARLLMRLFYDGFVEIIPFAYANNGVVLRARTAARIANSIGASFVYLQTLSIPLHGATGSILIDAGRLIDPTALASHLSLEAIAGKLFWNEINPRRGNLFQSVGGILLQAGGEEIDIERATELTKMALRADECSEECVVYVELPSDSCGFARVNGVSCRSPNAPGVQQFHAKPGHKAEIIAAAAFALCDRWESHSVLPVHSDPFGVDLSSAITRRQIRIALDEADRLGSAHDTLTEFSKLAGFWRGARDNPRVRAALSVFQSEAIDELDILYGDYA